MDVFFTGGTGLVGRAVIARLVARGDGVQVLTRDPDRARERLPSGVTFHKADPQVPGPWQDIAASVDAVVNLAGESVADGRWNGAKKRRLRRSRLATTKHVVEGIVRNDRCRTLVSASATGYYGDRGGEALTETHEPGSDFLARLAHEWERAAREAESDSCRVVCLRIGVVLSRDGGALPKMLPTFRLGLGGSLGGGRQYFPWIHVDDLAAIVLFTLDEEGLSGPVNAVAPDPPTQGSFARALCTQLHRPCAVPTPAFALRIAVGELAEALLASQRVVPNALKAAGYRFEYTDVEAALADLLA